MKLYYFNPNAYGDQYFVMAENKAQAFEYLLASSKIYKPDREAWEKVDILNLEKLPFGYTLDEYEKGEVIRSEIA